MDDVGRASYINSQVACAMIHAMAYQAENTQRQIEGKSLAYTEVDFLGLMSLYNIGHNAVLNYLA